MKIDVHAHIYPKAYLDEVAAIVKNDSSPKGRDMQRVVGNALSDRRMWSVEDRLEILDKLSVDMQVLSLSIPNVYFPDRETAVTLCQMANDTFVEMARAHPRHFRVFASVPLQFPDEAMRELTRMADKPEVVGLVLGANVDGQPLDSPDFLPIYAELERRNLPFFMHPMRPPGIEAMMQYNQAPMCGYLFDSTLATLRLVFAGVFERHPRLTLIMPHLGAVAPYMLGRVQYGFEHFPVCREHLSTPPQTFFQQRFYYDTVCHSVPALHFACSMFGTERILFGTDFPFNDDVDNQRGGLEALGLPAETLEGIFSGNALRLFAERIDLAPARKRSKGGAGARRAADAVK